MKQESTVASGALALSDCAAFVDRFCISGGEGGAWTRLISLVTARSRVRAQAREFGFCWSVVRIQIGVWAMDVTTPYEFIVFGAMDVTKPYEFIVFGAMDVTKPCDFIGFGALGVNTPYGFIGFGDS